MKIHILAVGKAKAGPLRDLYQEYIGRLQWPVSLKEIDSVSAPTSAVLKEKEGERLMAAIPEGAKAIALDEKGQNLDSIQFAQRLGQWRDDGLRDLVFIIGGADGLSPAIRSKAQLVLSFGALTWPHMLVRAMLAEQLYRTQQILSGHPYHRS